LVDSHYAEERWASIEKVQDWFQKKGQFWLVLSILTFSSVLVLQILFSFASQANPAARQQAEFLIIPVLALFTFSIFWRNIFCTFLSFTGAMLTYGGMFFFHTINATTQLVTPYITNRLGYGIKHIAIIAPNSVADRYFIVGAFALAFCLAIAIKPSFFKPKDSQGIPYPIWKHRRDLELAKGSNATRLVPLSSLMTFAEQNLVAKYKYIAVIIGGKKFLTSPYEWVPEDSTVVRDKESGSIIGI
jgi:hypothetical protein